MITNYKIFEIFDKTNIYPYQFISEKDSKDKDGKYKKFTYKFTTKDADYFVRIWYGYYVKDDWYGKNFITIDFMEEKQYKRNVNVDDWKPIDYVNTQKFDAIKVINTVFNILVEKQNEVNSWMISFNCTPDRFKTYEYCVNKYFNDYYRVDYCDDDEGKCYFYLYSQLHYELSEDGTELKRKDNKEVVYSSKDDN
jgi:hypothetical protein